MPFLCLGVCTPNIYLACVVFGCCMSTYNYYIYFVCPNLSNLNCNEYCHKVQISSGITHWHAFVQHSKYLVKIFQFNL